MAKPLLFAAVIAFAVLELAGDPAQEGDRLKSKDSETVIKTDLQAPVVTLKKMTEDASLIFVGTVERVTNTTKKITSSKESVEIPVQVITFAVSKVLKGDDLKAGTNKTIIHQYGRTPSPVKEGEELLWYLPRASKHGLVSPIGFYSGHFVIREEIEGEYKVKVASNLKNNEGLWLEGEPILSVAKARQLEAMLLKMNIPTARISKTVAIATAPYSPDALPIELLFFATEIYLQHRK